MIYFPFTAIVPLSIPYNYTLFFPSSAIYPPLCIPYNYTTLFFPSTAIVPPLFKRPLEGKISVEQGFRHVIDCEAAGTPTPLITWYKDWVAVNLTEPRISVSKNRTRLMFSSLTQDDSGLYTCEAANRGGVALSNLTLAVEGMSLHFS